MRQEASFLVTPVEEDTRQFLAAAPTRCGCILARASGQSIIVEWRVPKRRVDEMEDRVVERGLIQLPGRR